MKKNHLHGKPSSLSVGGVILFVMVLMFLGCSKKDQKNPVKPYSDDTVTDIDGNSYRTVKIGNQLWLAENLKVTHFRNGDTIPNVTDGTTWSNLTTGAYCDYDNDSSNVSTYGRLYNWYAANDSSNIAPAGWHVPTETEWQTLVDYLGDWAVAGGKLKETGTTRWHSPNAGATNESGFSALPGGYRDYDGDFEYVRYDAKFWSSSKSENNASYRSLSYRHSELALIFCPTQGGFSIRLVRD
jgi:uncharacterized protein (TIGR02145 family)